MRPLLPSLALSGVVLTLATGCVSASDVASESQQVRIAPPIAEAAEVCPPLTGAELTSILGTPFPPEPTVTAADAQSAECRFVATNREAFVITRTYTREPATRFKQSLRQAERTLGALSDIDVKGAKAAYAVPSVGRYGLLTSDAYIEVDFVVPGLSLLEVAKVLRATLS